MCLYRPHNFTRKYVKIDIRTKRLAGSNSKQGTTQMLYSYTILYIVQYTVLRYVKHCTCDVLYYLFAVSFIVDN